MSYLKYRIKIVALILSVFSPLAMSQQVDQLVSGTFRNGLNQPAQIFHVDETGKATLFNELKPGASYEQAMYPGNRWEIRVGDQPVSVFVASREANQIFTIQLQRQADPAPGKADTMPASAPQPEGLVTGSFQNALNQPAQVFHMGDDGKATFYHELKPGESFEQQMYPGNRWQIRVGNQPFTAFVASEDAKQVFTIGEQPRTQQAERKVATAPAAVMVQTPEAQATAPILTLNGNLMHTAYKNMTGSTIVIAGYRGNYYVPNEVTCPVEGVKDGDMSKWSIYPADVNLSIGTKSFFGKGSGVAEEPEVIDGKKDKYGNDFYSCRVSFSITKNTNAKGLSCRFRSGKEALKVNKTFKGNRTQNFAGIPVGLSDAIIRNVIEQGVGDHGPIKEPYTRVMFEEMKRKMLGDNFMLEPGEYVVDYPMMNDQVIPAEIAMIDLWTDGGGMEIIDLSVSVNGEAPVQFEGTHWVNGTSDQPVTAQATGTKSISLSGLWKDLDAPSGQNEYWVVQSGSGANESVLITPKGTDGFATFNRTVLGEGGEPEDFKRLNRGTYKYSPTETTRNLPGINRIFAEGSELLVQGSQIIKMSPRGRNAHPIQLVRQNAGAFSDRALEPYSNWVTREQPLPSNRIQREKYANSFAGAGMGTAESFVYNGYNIVMMNPLDLTEVRSRIPLFDRKRLDTLDYYEIGGFRMPGFLDVVLAPKEDNFENTSVFFSESERIESSGVTVDVGGGAKGVGAGIGYSQTETESSSLKESRMSVRGTKAIAKFWLTMVKEKTPLNSGFMFYILDDSNFQSDEDYNRFFETFGTHYPLSTLFGAMAVRETQVDTSEAMEAFSKTSNLTMSGSGGAKGADFKGSVGISDSSSNTDKSGTSSGTTKETSIGGDGGYSGLNVNTSNAAPIKVVLRPITELLRPELFGMVNDNAGKALLAKRRKEIDAKLTSYLNKAAAADIPKNYTPRRMQLKVKSLKVTESDDSDGPDIWGYVNVIVEVPGEKTRTFKIWNKKTEWADVSGWFPGVEQPGEFYLPGGKDFQIKLTYDFHVNEGDSPTDGSSDEDRDDWMYRKGSSVTQMQKLGVGVKNTREILRAKIKGSEKAEGIGTVEIDADLVELPFVPENKPFKLSEFPYRNVR